MLYMHTYLQSTNAYMAPINVHSLEITKSLICPIKTFKKFLYLSKSTNLAKFLYPFPKDDLI